MLEPTAGKDQLASLLFYRGQSGPPDEGPFLFGHAAENAASLQWANLVRSIKSVIARDPTTVWHFLGETRGGINTFRSLELLEVFIEELKRRSEVGVRSLPASFLEELDITASGVRFAHVVFTHPVGASEAVLQALHHAARTAGLVDDDVAFEAFVQHQCLDEALAASVAFAYVIAAASDEHFPAALEQSEALNLICVDVGGGTTDFAAVQIEGLSAFRAGGRDDVAVRLMASGGDDRFGGDDIDRVLATAVLEHVQTSDSSRIFDFGAMQRALSLPSFESYRRHEIDRVEATGQVAGPEVDQLAQSAFSAASDLLRACEAAKRKLSEQASAQVSPQVADWPLRTPGQRLEPGSRLDVNLLRTEMAQRYRPLVQACANRLDQLIDGAGWTWPEVGGILFTGQGSLLPEFRHAVREHAAQQRGSEASALYVVEPGDLEGFDPKHCVAMGAAVWGDSHIGGGGWLKVSHRSADVLSYALCIRRGPRFIVLQGLEPGASFPAQADFASSAPTQVVSLYRDRRLLWTFSLPNAASELQIVIESDHAAYVLADGVRTQGVRSADA